MIRTRRRPAAFQPLSFTAFRDRYFSEACCFFKSTTQDKVAQVFASLESLVHPQRIDDVTASLISSWAALRKRSGVSDATIKGNLAYLQAALNWAVKQKIIPEVPHIDFPRRVKNQRLMKGRAIRQEEFDRIKSHCSDSAVCYFLDGLWWSGLRLSEALALTWDCGDLSVDMSGKYPRFSILAEAEKGNTDRLLTVAPEFCQTLVNTPETIRIGKVFKVPFRRLDCASAAISALGEAAGVVVNRSPLKYASAHDFRRSFGTRWAMRVKPAVLMNLMRHSSIETTLRYYVDQDSDEISEIVHSAIDAARQGSV